MLDRAKLWLIEFLLRATILSVIALHSSALCEYQLLSASFSSGHPEVSTTGTPKQVPTSAGFLVTSGRVNGSSQLFFESARGAMRQKSNRAQPSETLHGNRPGGGGRVAEAHRGSLVKARAQDHPQTPNPVSGHPGPTVGRN